MVTCSNFLHATFCPFLTIFTFSLVRGYGLLFVFSQPIILCIFYHTVFVTPALSVLSCLSSFFFFFSFQSSEIAQHLRFLLGQISTSNWIVLVENRERGRHHLLHRDIISEGRTSTLKGSVPDASTCKFLLKASSISRISNRTTTMIRRTAGLSKLVQSVGVGSSSSLPTKLRDHRCFGSGAASNAEQACEASVCSKFGKNEYADVDWDNLGFGLVPTDYMYMMKCSNNGIFEQGQLNLYGNIELSPAAGVLNYGQGIYEGMKAFRKEDGNLLIFRPDQNAMRMKIGSERMCMPSPSLDQFIDAVKQTAQANKCWVPPPGKGSLYIRPLLIGSGPILGLGTSPEYTFLVYASPVRNYFKEGSAPLSIYVEEEYDRSSRGGAGGVKSITNYAPVLKALLRAKSRGYSDVLYLDSVNKKNLEEVSSCNIFIVKGNVISTPTTAGTILSGVTRKSIIEIARDHGYQVEERAIPVDELSEADEVFCTGTAVGVAPVGNITYKDRRMEYKTGVQTVCPQLYSTLIGIQTGRIEDKKGWILEID